MEVELCAHAVVYAEHLDYCTHNDNCNVGIRKHFTVGG